MKNLKLFSVFCLLFTAFNNISCTTDVEPLGSGVLNPIIDPNNPMNSFFKVDFNGVTFEATTKTAVIGNGKIEIAGIKGANNETVGIIIQGTTTGTYTTEALLGYSENATNEYAFASLKLDGTSLVNTATVTITNINTTTKIITGTFNFVGHWSDFSSANPPSPIEFTNGTFSIPYTTPNSNPNPLNGTFTATIDGEQYVANEITAIKSLISGPLSFAITGNIANGLLGKSMTLQFFQGSINTYLLPDQGLINYLPDVLSLQMYSSFNLDNPFENVGQIEITSIDEINKKISGKFNSKVFYIDPVTQTVIGSKIITNGVFTNVTYTIE